MSILSPAFTYVQIKFYINSIVWNLELNYLQHSPYTSGKIPKVEHRISETSARHVQFNLQLNLLKEPKHVLSHELYKT